MRYGIKSFRARTLGAIIGCAVAVALLTSGTVCLVQESRLERARLDVLNASAARAASWARSLMQDADRLASAACLAPAVQAYLRGEGSEVGAEEALRALEQAWGAGEARLRPKLWVEGLNDRAGRVRGLEAPIGVEAEQGARRMEAGEGGGLCALWPLTDLDAQGLDTRGAVTVEIEGDGLARALGGALEDTGGAWSLCQADGTVLASSKDEPGQVDAAAAQRSEGVWREGQGAQAQWVRALALPEYGLTLVARWPGEKAAPEGIARIAALAVALSAALAALMGAAAGDGLLQPLRRLGASLRRAEAGGASGTLEPCGCEEIDALIARYNDLKGSAGDWMARSKQSEKERREAEFQALQAQIHPHFLYNTLDAVNWLAIAYEADDISTIVTALSDFFRLSLSGGRNIISLRDEFQHVKSYLEILKVRLGDAIRYEMNLPPELGGCAVAKLTLQPLVENAVEHGLRPRDGGGTIWIYAKREKDDLKLFVEDDGVGCSIDEMEASIRRERRTSSYGVYNVNARIKMAYGEQYGLAYSPREGGGLTACVTLPVRDLDDMDALS